MSEKKKKKKEEGSFLSGLDVSLPFNVITSSLTLHIKSHQHSLLSFFQKISSWEQEENREKKQIMIINVEKYKGKQHQRA